MPIPTATPLSVSVTTLDWWNQLGPWRDADNASGIAGNGYPLLTVLDAIGSQYNVTEQYTRDDPTHIGWGQLLDVNACPTFALPWLAQFAGVSIPVGSTDPQMRALITSQANTKRGTPATLIAILKSFLTGTQIIQLLERTPDPYSFTIACQASQIAGGAIFDSQLASFVLAAWWKLADAYGSTSAIDSSGNGLTGTVVGGVTYGGTGPNNLGIPTDTTALFNGTTDAIATTYTPPSLTSMSVMGWYRTTASGTMIIADSGQTASLVSMSLSMASGIVQCRVYTGALHIAADTITTNDGNWHMVVGTFTGSQLRLYRDGVLVATSGTVTGTLAAGTVLTIGACRSWAGYWLYSTFWAGQLSQVAFLQSALSGAQITALWNSQFSQAALAYAALLAAKPAGLIMSFLIQAGLDWAQMVNYPASTTGRWQDQTDTWASLSRELPI
jgi:hypothetical protein